MKYPDVLLYIDITVQCLIVGFSLKANSVGDNNFYQQTQQAEPTTPSYDGKMLNLHLKNMSRNRGIGREK